MNTGKQFSPKEIGRSFAELLGGLVRSVWFVLGVFIPGALAIIKDAEPQAELKLSARGWGAIAVGCAAVSIAVVYHRARWERDIAHVKDVPPEHRDDLQRRLSVLLRNVDSESGCDYDDVEYSHTNQLSLKAHYRDLETPLDDWHAAVHRVGDLKRAITTAIDAAINTTDETAPWFGVNADEYDVGHIRTLIQESVERRSGEGTLDAQLFLSWRDTPPFPPRVPVEGPDPDAFWKLELGGGHHVATVLDLPVEDRDERIAATKLRVATLWLTAMGLEAAKELRPARTRLTGLQQHLQSALVDWQKVTNVRVTSRCPICRKNEGWPEPKPPLWPRLRTRTQHAWGRVRGNR
jgi:hypothetical protein